MLTRRAVLRLPALGLIARASFADVPTTKRALVVGINEYIRPSEPTDAGAGQSSAAASLKRGSWGPLDGCVNDATLMQQILKDRFGFPPANIVFLKDLEATRERILQEFKRHLIDAASPGDVSLFYYAGHGSQVKNLASTEADQMDETLVPVDVPQGARDIRDKEMARLYRATAQKGVSLTVILDSCHSGGMSRGLWNGGGKARYMPPDPRPVSDPDRNPVTGEKPPDAASLGVLFLFAARDDQLASEASTSERGPNGEAKQLPHGAFTAALASVLQSPMAGQSVEQICERVQAILASQGKTQIPICAGKDRGSRGLLGQPAGLGAAVSISVVGVGGDGTVHLRGGSALGLAPGCTLVKMGGQPARLELTRVELATSEAKLKGGASANSLHAGDLFKLESWVAPPANALKVHFPKKAPVADSILATARTIAQLSGQNGIEILSEVTPEKPPTHVLYWNDEGAYYLERNPANGRPVRLGPAPTAAELSKALAGGGAVRLWPILPPDPTLASHIGVGAGTQNPAAQVVSQPADATYFLAGRLNQGALEYAWIFKDALGADTDQARLPLRSDWKDSGEQLTGLAVSLARIYGWLNLDSPPGSDDSFPYKLVVENVKTKETAGSSPVKVGDQFKIVFTASPEMLRQAAENGGVDKRYVYVFVIDSTGQAQCIFPDPANGNEKNRIPRGSDTPTRIEATRELVDVTISPPLGVDNYFLVATREPMDPGIFQWSGVRSAEGTRGLQNPLEFLFSSVSEGTRGIQASHSVPVTWSIQSMPVRSVAAAGG